VGGMLSVEQRVGAVAGGAALVEPEGVDGLPGHRLDRPAVQLGDATGGEHPCQVNRCMPRLFITGLAGLLGGELAARADGWSVAGSIFERPGPPRVEATRVDVRDEPALRAALRGADVVVHTAYRQDDESVTVDGAAIVARCAPGRLIHLSTDVIFSGALGRPLREEDMPDPVTDYGRWKARAEELILAARPDALLIRASLMYRGDGSTRHEQLARDPSMSFYDDELRSPVQVGDLAAAILELATFDVAGPLHVAGADGLSRLEFARLIAGPSVRGGPRPPGRPGDCRLDSSRAQSLLRTRLRGAREVLGEA
jgi:dTDP-4-dehydrorhamnose reductase